MNRTSEMFAVTATTEVRIAAEIAASKLCSHQALADRCPLCRMRHAVEVLASYSRTGERAR